MLCDIAAGKRVSTGRARHLEVGVGRLQLHVAKCVVDAKKSSRYMKDNTYTCTVIACGMLPVILLSNLDVHTAVAQIVRQFTLKPFLTVRPDGTRAFAAPEDLIN